MFLLSFFNLLSIFFFLCIPQYQLKKLYIGNLLFSLISFCVWFYEWNFIKSTLSFCNDFISSFFILLTIILILCCNIYNSVYFLNGYKYFMLFLLILQFLLINVFVANNLLIFFIYFESVLLPMLLIIGMWGSRQRKIHALFYLFFYTLVGSVFMLTAIIYIYMYYGNLDYYFLLYNKFTFIEEIILLSLFFLGFAVKVPLWPFHIWLPEAHVESPTSGSVVLAGILLKLGTYGLLRYLLPLFPNGAYYMLPFVYTLCLLGIIFCSFVILRQIDLKKIIAYSSVIHMSYCIIGLFSFNTLGIVGSVLTMFSHGIISGALFFLVGSLYEKYHTRNILYYGGLSTIIPIHTTYFLLFSLANMSLPGLFSFVGELLILLGIADMSILIFVLLCIFTFFSVIYSIWLYNRVCFGQLNINYIKKGYDCSQKEIFIFSFLGSIVIIFGLFPEILLMGIEISLINLLKYF